MRHFVFLIAIFVSLIPDLRAAEPFFKPNDVVALVGGEDMVVAAELGYLETLIQLALPDHHLKFRSLAREGDTVFEQRRDLNYPKLEDQLDKMGATVVICQFGQMESLAACDAVEKIQVITEARRYEKWNAEIGSGKDAREEFDFEKADVALKPKIATVTAGYEKFLTRMSNEGKRRLVVCEPYFMGGRHGPVMKNLYLHHRAIILHNEALETLANKTGARFAKLPGNHFRPSGEHDLTSDGFRLSNDHQALRAAGLADELALAKIKNFEFGKGFPNDSAIEKLRPLITAKNRLWYYYYRPQNWAFLAGDRTNQPSSRDHLDPSKRWFPEELEKFVPLIDAKDAEIWALAKKLSAQGGK